MRQRKPILNQDDELRNEFREANRKLKRKLIKRKLDRDNDSKHLQD